jgi:hypothetical protein
VVSSDGMRGVFPSRNLPSPKYTTIGELLEMGYVVRGNDTTWTDEEVK